MRWTAVLLCLPLFCCDDDSKSDVGRTDAEVSAPKTDASAANAQDAGTKPPVVRDAMVVDSSRTVSDAGPTGSDAGSEDAGPTGCAAAKFCDDFEGAQIDSAWVNKQGTVELDSTKKVRGQKSLHAHSVNNSPSIIAHRASFPMANERFWMRVFVNIKNLPSPDWAHWSLMWTIPEGNQWSVVEHRLGGQNQTDKKLYWGVGSDHGESGDWTNIDTSSVVKLDTWQCVEVMIDATQDISEVYRDGVKIDGLGTTRNVKHQGNASTPYDIPPVRAMYIGFFYYQGATPNVSYDLWFDSFALDEERIGCSD